MIAQDLQDMHKHPFRTAAAMLVTLLIVFVCVAGCGSVVFWLVRVVVEVV